MNDFIAIFEDIVKQKIKQIGHQIQYAKWNQAKNKKDEAEKIIRYSGHRDMSSFCMFVLSNFSNHPQNSNTLCLLVENFYLGRF